MKLIHKFIIALILAAITLPILHGWTDDDLLTITSEQTNAFLRPFIAEALDDPMLNVISAEHTRFETKSLMEKCGASIDFQNGNCNILLHYSVMYSSMEKHENLIRFLLP